MEVIIELLQIFKKEGLRSAGLIPTNSNNLSYKYMELILENDIRDDDNMAKAIYKTDKSDPRYKNLKKRVKKKLLEAIPLVDRKIMSFRSEYGRAYYDCLKAVSNIKLLSKIGAYSTIQNIINQHYKVAQKYQFFEVLKEFSYCMVKIHSMKGNSKIVREETLRLNNYLIEEHNEITVRKILFITLVDSIRCSSINKSQLDEITEQINILDQIAAKSISFEVKYWSYYTKIHYYTLVKNYELLSNTYKAFEQFFLKCQSNYNPARKLTFALNKVLHFFQFKDYKKGLIMASNSHFLIQGQRKNWLLLKRYEFCNAINVDLERALFVFNEVFESDFFNILNNQAVIQLWYIHGAYLQFMLHYSGHPMAKKFKVPKFINDVEIYSKDKSGYNFSIIVVELLFSLLKNNRDNYIDKMTALMSYRLRHLRDGSFKRSNVFAQLLLEVEKRSFDVKKISSITQNKYEYLISLEDRLNINEWEIVGYDRLWEIVLELLERKM